ncbi:MULTISPECIES: hypothetical protein [Cyanophyceae]|uniref:hypothetical protein n=1 Tax=Cyanophyceae TaxID=3028117 RepID=UPI0016832848|nr:MULTISPECIES: hypothetical protein [Cyanophyceae]MBD1915301.1 hypothetical protein [Phormidium sp. FACHB-77]MBD2031745.1 hypothetical protein [Phormidium sp. FACHB-322]MBD2051821.1 hypothetical protein [Leptolyngbya sp. FACHB-60]
MRFQDPQVAIALHRLEMVATVAAVFAAATFVGTATTLVAIEQAETSGQSLVMPSEAALWQGLGQKAD